MRSTLLALPVMLLAAPTALAANESADTKIGTPPAQGCTELESNPDEGGSYVMRCRGHAGVQVIVAEGDLRTFVSYGWNARGEQAASQTFPNFNSVNDTIEWRLKDGKPFATILRWKIDGGEGLPKGEALVVTQLNEGNQCWVAVVSATKNEKANELARQAADELGGKVTCTEGMAPKVYGTPHPELGVGE